MAEREGFPARGGSARLATLVGEAGLRRRTCEMFGGRGEIRTRESFDTLLAFQASALGHYATLPYVKLIAFPPLAEQAHHRFQRNLTVCDG